MGCKSTNEKYREQLIKISKLPEKDTKYLIEQIIINTNFNEKDIYFLFCKFCKLEPNSEFKISNNQLIELPEFKFCPFKSHLIRVFGLDNSKEDYKQEYDESEEEGEEEKEETIKNSSNKKTNHKHNNFMTSMDKSNLLTFIHIKKIK